jgi:hypothetical protein
MFVVGSIASDFATVVGLVAGLIAVGGFVGHAPSVLQGAAEEQIRRGTVIGGLGGSAVGLFVMLLSAMVDRLSL